MLKFATLAVVLCAMSATTAWAEPPVRHAGEWETTIDNGKPIRFCYPTDATLDQNYVMQSMSKIPGASCTGEQLEYRRQCDLLFDAVHDRRQPDDIQRIDYRDGSGLLYRQGAQPRRHDKDA